MVGTQIRSSRSTSPRTAGPASCLTLPGRRRSPAPPEPLLRPYSWPSPFLAPLTFPSAAYDLVRFFRSSSARQPELPIGHVDHMRTTSIPSNDGWFTCHLHISRQSNIGHRLLRNLEAIVSEVSASRAQVRGRRDKDARAVSGAGAGETPCCRTPSSASRCLDASDQVNSDQACPVRTDGSRIGS